MRDEKREGEGEETKNGKRKYLKGACDKKTIPNRNQKRTILQTQEEKTNNEE